MSRYYILILVIAICCNYWAVAQDSLLPEKDSEFHLYILMGQSNMAGRGQITPALAHVQHSRVYVLDKTDNWAIAKHPVHYDKPEMAGVGPGLSFGIEMAKADSNVTIGLIPCAVGGTSIDKWQAGAYDEATQTYPYDEAIARIKLAMKKGVVKGMLWHQGEGNASTKSSQGYTDKLAKLTAEIRALSGDPELPVVIGELGGFSISYQEFNKVLQEAVDKIPVAAIAASEGLIDKGDKIHFDGASAHEFGKRFAVQMILLQEFLAEKANIERE